MAAPAESDPRRGVATLRPRVEASPPLSIPLRFMLTAPGFALAAAGAVAAAGPHAWAAVSHPRMLAATHLLTLGVITMTMFGALFQLLPAVAGARVPGVRVLGSVVHAALTLGTLAMAAGFWWRAPWALGAGGAALILAFGLWVVAALGTLLTAERRGHPSVRGMGLALIGALTAAASGAWMLAVHVFGVGSVPPALRGVHVGWGLVAWFGVLIVSVAVQVLPLLGLTRPYPVMLSRAIAPLLGALIVAWSAVLAVGGGGTTLARGAELGIALTLMAFALVTLRVMNHRRPDPTVGFWWLAMLSLLGATGLWLVHHGYAGADAPLGFLVGLVYLVGAVVAVISGMLYRIVPFLLWVHLQFARGWPHPQVARSPIPNVQALVPRRAAWAQLGLQAAGLVLAVVAVPAAGPWLYPAAGLLALAMLVLWANLLWALARYAAARWTLPPDAARGRA